MGYTCANCFGFCQRSWIYPWAYSACIYSSWHKASKHIDRQKFPGKGWLCFEILSEYLLLRLLWKLIKCSYLKVADFGLTKLTEVGSSSLPTGRLVGTFGYMPPEYGLLNIYSSFFFLSQVHMTFLLIRVNAAITIRK